MPIILDDDLTAEVHDAIVDYFNLLDDLGRHAEGDVICRLMEEYERCYERRISSQIVSTFINKKSLPAFEKAVQTTFFP